MEDKKDILVEQVRRELIDDVYVVPAAGDRKVYRAPQITTVQIQWPVHCTTSAATIHPQSLTAHRHHCCAGALRHLRLYSNGWRWDTAF